MSDLLAKMEAEQAAGWPTPFDWSAPSPSPLLTEYVLTIRRTVNAARKATSSHMPTPTSATMAGQKNEGRATEFAPPPGLLERLDLP